MTTYRDGTLNLTNGSQNVSITGGTTGVGLIEVGSLITSADLAQVAYTVDSIVDLNNFTLSDGYNGPTNATASYESHNDFTPLGVPIVQDGDLYPFGVLREAHLKLEELFAANFLADSTTSLAIGTGTKVFTLIQENRQYMVGQRILVNSKADTNNNMCGLITDYTGNILTILVDTIGGSGTFADWSLGLVGATGATGAQGPAGPAGTNGTNGTNGTDGTNGTNGINGTDGADGADGTAASIIDRNLTAPPGSPTVGDEYIPASPATGAWTGQENSIAKWNGSIWEFKTPKEGWLAWIVDEGRQVRWDGSTWANWVNQDLSTDASPSFASVTTTADVEFNGVDVGRGAGDIGSNTAVGATALDANTTGIQNTAIGAGTLAANTTGIDNTAVGKSAMAANTTGQQNVAVGTNALTANTTTHYNTAVGYVALESNTADYNTAVGYGSMQNNTTGVQSAALGRGALAANTTGNYNAAVGDTALNLNTTGSYNTAIGLSAMGSSTADNSNTALGAYALNTSTGYSNSAGVGYNAQVTGSFQIQLGDTFSTPYAYAALVVRSDERDKTDIRDTLLGLDWINKLRPVDYKWDMREDYKPAPLAPFIEIDPLVSLEGAPTFDLVKPEAPEDDEDAEAVTQYEADLATYNTALAVHEIEFDAWSTAASAEYETAKAEYDAQKAAWLEANKLSNITHDGTHTRTRYHHGFVAQEVQQIIADTGIDFGGFKDASHDGGEDVLSLAYEELFGPLVKAVQELSAKNDELVTENSNLKTVIDDIEARLAMLEA